MDVLDGATAFATSPLLVTFPREDEAELPAAPCPSDALAPWETAPDASFTPAEAAPDSGVGGGGMAEM